MSASYCIVKEQQELRKNLRDRLSQELRKLWPHLRIQLQQSSLRKNKILTQLGHWTLVFAWGTFCHRVSGSHSTTCMKSGRHSGPEETMTSWPAWPFTTETMTFKEFWYVLITPRRLAWLACSKLHAFTAHTKIPLRMHQQPSRPPSSVANLPELAPGIELLLPAVSAVYFWTPKENHMLPEPSNSYRTISYLCSAQKEWSQPRCDTETKDQDTETQKAHHPYWLPDTPCSRWMIKSLIRNLTTMSYWKYPTPQCPAVVCRWCFVDGCFVGSNLFISAMELFLLRQDLGLAVPLSNQFVKRGTEWF